MWIFFLLKLFLLLLIHNGDCARILGVFPVPARSHVFLGTSLMRGLADKGHHITIITPYKETYKPKNGTYTEIVLDEVAQFADRQINQLNFLNNERNRNPLSFFPTLLEITENLTILTLQDAKVQNLLKTGKFDVVILEQFLNDALKGFANHFKAPLILFSPTGANLWLSILTGNPNPTSYVPDLFLGSSSEMSFFERFANTLWSLVQYVTYHWNLFPRHEKIYNKYFPNNDPFYDVLYNISLVFLVSHPSIQDPVPLIPNMIEIGGLHVKPSKTLPRDLQEFMDNAKEGVIYFSMGSNIKSRDFPTTKRDAILKSFAKLKEKVLWKWEDDDLPGKPSNIKIGKWLPQQEILAHPNLKVFITHGGLLSTTETIYNGVPVLTIPITADQKMNAQRMVNSGFAVYLNYEELSEKVLSEKLFEILNNPKYGENAKKRSVLFHDRLVPPLETGIYWVEYVIRYKGAQGLQIAGAHLPWYKYYLLDIFAFLFVIFYSGVKMLKFVVSLCMPGKRKVKQN